MRAFLPALACVLCLGLLMVCAPFSACAESFDLASAVAFALAHNPSLRMAEKDIDAEAYGIGAAKAERMPRVDFGSGVTRYRYPTPLTPIVLTPPIIVSILELPDFERTIYDAGASFRLPLYRGGRIAGNIRIAAARKALAEENYAASRQDLIFNVTSVYHKILQLQRLLAANDASVAQLEGHLRDVTHLLRAGTVPRLDYMKTEVELAHVRDSRLLARNNLESTFALLRALMGMEEPTGEITLVEPPPSGPERRTEQESMETALRDRPDYRAVAKKITIAEDRIKVARGKWLPDVYGSGQYVKRAGDGTSFQEDWVLGLRLTVPVFDGGLIRSEVDREKAGLEKARQEERALRLTIQREVKDAHLGIRHASDRMQVAYKAIESARETLRVERLKYETGAGTSTDVIDARAALLRSESAYYQALYDREIALASLRKAMGENPAATGGP